MESEPGGSAAFSCLQAHLMILGIHRWGIAAGLGRPPVHFSLSDGYCFDPDFIDYLVESYMVQSTLDVNAIDQAICQATHNRNRA